jgi:hypothetical protein
MKRFALLLALGLAIPAFAQDEAATPAEGPEFTDSDGADLRFLDKLTSETGDVNLGFGQSAKFGRLLVQLNNCRYPTANPASDAEAHLTIVDESTGAVAFSGWMLASSPALSALDHPRYDVWVLSCNLPDAPSEATTSDGEGG